MKPLNGQISISRPSHSDDRPEFVRLAINDVDAKVQFLEIEVELADFAAALTGLSNQPCVIKPNRLDVVGRVREVESVTFVLRDDYLDRYGVSKYDRVALAKLLTDDPDHLFQKEGWKLSTYLGSQSSISPNFPNGIRINTSRVRYVDKKDPA